MRFRAHAVALTAAIGLSLLAGCGEDDETTTAASRPVETADELPELPPGWTEYSNRDGGYEVGIPPGWFARRRGARTELLSPEQLASVAISIDRTDEVLDVPLEQLASATIASGSLGLTDVEPGEARPFGHRYDAFAVKATGFSDEANVEERLLLAVVRREGIATFTVLAAVNAENHPRFYEDEIERIIRSLRSRPINPPG